MLLLSSPSSSSFSAIVEFKRHPLFHFHVSPTFRISLSPRRIFLRCAANGTTAVDSFTEKSGYLFDLSEYEAESLAEYSVSKIAAIYRRKPLVVLRRFLQVGSTFGRWFGLRFIDDLRERSDLMFEVRAAELRNILVELGPAYIKVAQAISSRADLIPPSYLDELSLLQDQIAPFSSELAFDTIERELNIPLDELFSEISPEPTAAASLGQVYKARLRHNGQVVAVKVQRPGVQAAISLDILILRYLAAVFRKVAKLNTDLQAVVDEWATSLFKEMDYRREAKNGRKFRQLYGSLPDVLVPQMLMEHTTRRVLTMEWVKGQKLTEVNDLYLVEVGVYCSFNQLLEYGFYHADPHPGNLLRTSDGKLAYLDFGMMGEFKQELRDGFIEACLHLVNRDFDALAKDFVTLGLLPPTADKQAVTQALTAIFQNAVSKGVRSISFGDLLGNLGTTMYKFKFRIPSYFSLVIRSLAVLEGIAVSFNPNYKVLGSTYPWIARKVLTDNSPKLKSSLLSLLYKEGIFRIDRLESLVIESLRARTEKSSVRKDVEDQGNRIVVKEVLSFALSEKGSFLRDLLLQEIAKGLDALGLAALDSITSMTAARIPFGSSTSVSVMTNEDVNNLRTLGRLILLLSGSQENLSNQSQMETIFISQDLWEIIEKDYEDEGTKEMTLEQEKKFRKNKRRTALALRLIQQGVSKSIFPRIFGIKKAKDAWEILQKEFKGSEKIISIKLQSLWRDFDNLTMKESENICEFFSRVAEIINQMKNYGETIPEKRVNEKVLRSLPPKFNHVVAAIEESKDLPKLTIFELMGSLQAHEERLNKCPTQAVEQAFHTKLNFAEKKTFKSNHKKRWNPAQKNDGQHDQRDKGEWHIKKSGNTDSYCIVCKKSNHKSKDCYFRCTKCWIANHFKQDCWFQNKKDEANFTKEDKGEQLFSCTIDQHESKSIWYVDSGCSNHMTGNEDFSVKLDRSFSSQVKLGNGKMHKAEGKGVILVHTKKGDTRYISDVLYVPGITQNLLSVGQLLPERICSQF